MLQDKAIDTTGWSKDKLVAYQQAQRKLRLEDSMKQYIASIKPTQHIQKELQTFELDPIGREVIIDKVKLKQNGK